MSFVFPGEFRLSFVDFRRHLQTPWYHSLFLACRLFGSRWFLSAPFAPFRARSTHARLPWGDNRPCVYLRKREGSSILSRSLVSFYQISESCGLQVRRFRNVLIGRHRNRMKPYEKQEQMFYHYSHSIVRNYLQFVPVCRSLLQFVPFTSSLRNCRESMGSNLGHGFSGHPRRFRGSRWVTANCEQQLMTTWTLCFR